MTNTWVDIGNSQCICIIGANPAENHPISMKWVLRAKEKGATVFHIDPRFSRTSQMVTEFAAIRPGTDIAFFGGMIRYIFKEKRIQEEYVRLYTNASFIVKETYGFNDGLFSGYDPQKHVYDRSTWAFAVDEHGTPKKDPTLTNPHCVYALLEKHYDRYTPEKVSSTTGIPKEQLLRIYDEYTKSYRKDKAACFMYALGQTQHSTGVQNIRCMGIIQLLLGNIGVAGGGVNALRGESNVQGATDIGLLSDTLPGYLKVPTSSMPDLASYNKAHTPAASYDPKSPNWWKNSPKYMASLLKASFPEVDIEESYTYVPKLDAHRNKLDYTWLAIFNKMNQGEIKGFFVWGMNPASSGPNSAVTRRGLEKLDWLVNVNVFENETGSFWKAPGVDSTKIATEVFFLPCAVSIEKEGSVVDSARTLQWRYAGPKPYGMTLPDGDIMLRMYKAIQDLYKKENGVFPKPILHFDTSRWANVHDSNEFSAANVAKIMNGYFLKDVTVNGKTYKKGEQVPSFTALQDDGSTACGIWIYSGCYTNEGNMMARRSKKRTAFQEKANLYPNWAFSWPANRRILYNRAGTDTKGVPWNSNCPVLAWENTTWVGDVPDGAGKPDAIYPFIMFKDGHGQLYTTNLLNGPIPEHYEPIETPLSKNPFSKQLSDPTTWVLYPKDLGDIEEYPCIATTMRVAEHWQTGVLSRNLPWLLQAEPQSFCLMNPEHAKSIGVENGDLVLVENKRGKVHVVAMVSERIQPMHVEGKRVYCVALPWHFSWTTPDAGESSNYLSASIGEANTGIPETKVMLVRVSKAQ